MGILISLILPTRGRPDSLKRLYDSAMKNADNPSQIEFCLYVDEDDQVLQDSEYFKLLPYNFNYKIGPRIVLSQMWNEAVKLASGEIFMHAGDDIIIQTKGWDTLVENAFAQYPDRIVLVGGNDGSGPKYHDGNFFTHGFIHRNWYNTLGHMFPNLYSSDYNDTHLNEVAKNIQRWHYIPELVTEHMHPDWGKGPRDQTHIDRAARHVKDNVRQLYDDNAHTRRADEQKLRDFIINFEG